MNVLLDPEFWARLVSIVIIDLSLAGDNALVIAIAVKLVRPGGHEEGHVRHGASLRQAVWIIVVADVTMSLDNVLAVAAAAHGDMVLVTLGIALSLPIVVWGSGFLARLMAHYAWIIWVGGGILGYVAGEMITDDPLVRSWLGAHADTVHDFVSVLLAAGLTALGWWLARAAASGPPARGEA